MPPRIKLIIPPNLKRRLKSKKIFSKIRKEPKKVRITTM